MIEIKRAYYCLLRKILHKIYFAFPTNPTLKTNSLFLGSWSSKMFIPPTPGKLTIIV